MRRILQMLMACALVGAGAQDSAVFAQPSPFDEAGHGTGLKIEPLANLQPVTLAGNAIGGNFLSPSALPGASVLPTQVDFSSDLGLVRSQGACGTCVAFANVAALEAEVHKLGRRFDDLSEQQTVSCSGLFSNCQEGTTLSGATPFLSRVGQVTEQTYPYELGNGGQVGSCRVNLETLGPGPVRAKAWRNYAIGNATDLKNVLFRLQRPVIAGMRVWTDFHQYSGGVYQPTAPSASQKLGGGHAVLVVGYSDAQAAFIVRNSWGSGWGDRGYFKIAYSEVSPNSLTGFGASGGGVTSIEGISSSTLPTYAQCTSSTKSTAYCDVSVKKGSIVDYVVEGTAVATSNGTRSGSMSLNMTANGKACNRDAGRVSGVDNETKLSGEGFKCTGRAIGGEQVRVALDAPNNRSDATYTVGKVTIVESSGDTTDAVCSTQNPSAAQCVLRVASSLRHATFTVSATARATSDGSRRGSMRLVLDVDGRPCNADATKVHGVDNMTTLSGPGFECKIEVPGGESRKVNISAPNDHADSAFTRATATYVPGPSQ